MNARHCGSTVLLIMLLLLSAPALQATSSQQVVLDGSFEAGSPNPYWDEGSTNWGFDEWILIQNPNDEACQVGVDYNTSGGLVPRAGFSLAGNSRITIHVNEDVPHTDTSARVYSDLPIIAERAMYWNSDGAGHVSQGLLK